MAKTQSLSLNPAKISGTCGRLMCCLKYEQEAYEHLIKTSPRADSFVDTPMWRGVIKDVNLLRRSVKVRLDNPSETTLQTFPLNRVGYTLNGEYMPPEPEEAPPPPPKAEPREQAHTQPGRERTREHELRPQPAPREGAEAQPAGFKKSHRPNNRRRRRPPNK
jgi:hypothetical protein